MANPLVHKFAFLRDNLSAYILGGVTDDYKARVKNNLVDAIVKFVRETGDVQYEILQRLNAEIGHDLVPVPHPPPPTAVISVPVHAIPLPPPLPQPVPQPVFTLNVSGNASIGNVIFGNTNVTAPRSSVNTRNTIASDMDLIISEELKKRREAMAGNDEPDSDSEWE